LPFESVQLGTPEELVEPCEKATMMLSPPATPSVKPFAVIVRRDTEPEATLAVPKLPTKAALVVAGTDGPRSLETGLGEGRAEATCPLLDAIERAVARTAPRAKTTVRTRFRAE
jgi:hypothetical protein